MSSLYEINEQLLNLTDSETGEITDWSAFEALQLARDEKIENIALYHKNLLAEAAALKAEEKSFSDRRKRAENKAESLKNYLATSLNGSKFNTTRVAINWRKSTSVEVITKRLSQKRTYALLQPLHLIRQRLLRHSRLARLSRAWR